MARKSTTDKNSEKSAAAKKTPAQREKEEKENRMAALDGIVKEKIHDQELLDDAAALIEIPAIAGKEVVHRKFGEGEILSSDGRFFQVSFSSGKKIKMQFPDAFDKEILTAVHPEDAEVFEEICAQFRNIDQQKEDVSRRIYEISAEMSRINL